MKAPSQRGQNVKLEMRREGPLFAFQQQIARMGKK